MKIRYLPLLINLAVLGTSSSAFAALTPAGTDVNNTATISFSVSGTPQTDQTSNTTTFAVDRKIDLTVTPPATHTPVVSLAPSKVLTFTLANTGNSTQDFSFVVTNQAGDNFDTASCATPTNLTNIASGAAAVNVDVICTMPDGLADADLSKVVLTATALEPTTVVTIDGNTVSGASGAAVTNDSANADDEGTVQTVFADASGSTDVAMDAKHSAEGTYEVQTATLSAVKSSEIKAGAVAPYTQRIPGATITYTIVVANAGTVDATNVNIQDFIPANTTYVASSVAVTSGTASYDVGTTKITTAGVIVPAAGNVTLTFDVTINE